MDDVEWPARACHVSVETLQPEHRSQEVKFFFERGYCLFFPMFYWCVRRSAEQTAFLQHGLLRRPPFCGNHTLWHNLFFV